MGAHLHTHNYFSTNNTAQEAATVAPTIKKNVCRIRYENCRIISYYTQYFYTFNEMTFDHVIRIIIAKETNIQFN